jgi:hypothetical protein
VIVFGNLFVNFYKILVKFHYVNKQNKLTMERIINKAKSHKEAEKWDILQQINMSPEERQQAAKKLKDRIYGKKSDMRKKIRNE